MSALLQERIASIPDALAIACAAQLPDLSSLAKMRRVLVTGGGLSEGPARVLVSLLQRGGRDARFVPQSAFVGRTHGDRETALVLFSQGLAPNARLPIGIGLRSERAQLPYGATLLVTSVVPGATGVAALAQRLVDAGALVWTLPPEREDQLLLRVVGPAVALVAAIRLAAALAADALDLQALPARVRARLAEPGVDLFGAQRCPIAIVAGADLVELAMPLRWKLLEGLRVSDPPIWDPLQIAHGPLQSFYEQPITLLSVRAGDDPIQDDLIARLRLVLSDKPARVIELRAQAGPTAIVELDAMLDAALLATLAQHPLALDDWPSRGLDGPLYDVDPDMEIRR